MRGNHIQPAMNILQELRNDIEGVKLLKDWLGDGEPVPQEQANARANVCVTGDHGKPCIWNMAPGWWDNIKNAIAMTIREELELKNHMQLRVADEEALAMCGACGCCLKLKVWTPTEHIKNHLPSVNFDKTPSFCWMRKEIEQ